VVFSYVIPLISTVQPTRAKALNLTPFPHSTTPSSAIDPMNSGDTLTSLAEHVGSDPEGLDHCLER